VRRLSRETELTVVLSLWGSAGPVVSLVSETGTGPILVTVRVGTTLDMDSAQGHLFLRFSKDHEAISKYWEGLDPVKRRPTTRRSPLRCAGRRSGSRRKWAEPTSGGRSSPAASTMSHSPSRPRSQGPAGI
jgi:DNA-binding IclR family transcriptional regulator